MKALILIVDGFEENSTFAALSLLKKADVEVTLAGLVSTVVQSENNVRIIAEKRVGEVNESDYDLLVLPAGKCYQIFLNSQRVINMIKDFNNKKKYIAAIGESPVVLAKANILEEKMATVSPGMENKIPNPRDAKLIVDTNIITARAPADSIEFAMKLVEILVGSSTMKKVKDKLWH